MWNHIDTPMIYSEDSEGIQEHEHGGIRISSFSNEHRKENPASVWISLHLFPCAKGPIPPAPPACPCPSLLRLLFPVLDFLSQAIQLDAIISHCIHAAILPHLCPPPYVLRNCWSSPLYSTLLTKRPQATSPSYPSFPPPSLLSFQ